MVSKEYKFLKNSKFMNLGCKYLIKITMRSRFQKKKFISSNNAPKGFKGPLQDLSEMVPQVILCKKFFVYLIRGLLKPLGAFPPAPSGQNIFFFGILISLLF